MSEESMEHRALGGNFELRLANLGTRPKGGGPKDNFEFKSRGHGEKTVSSRQQGAEDRGETTLAGADGSRQRAQLGTRHHGTKRGWGETEKRREITSLRLNAQSKFNDSPLTAHSSLLFKYGFVHLFLSF
jgi:hypothetical protein